MPIPLWRLFLCLKYFLTCPLHFVAYLRAVNIYNCAVIIEVVDDEDGVEVGLSPDERGSMSCILFLYRFEPDGILMAFKMMNRKVLMSEFLPLLLLFYPKVFNTSF